MNKTNNTELRPQELSKAKTVQVKLLIPYAIITIMLVSTAGLITGWTLRSEMNAKVDAEVAARFDNVKK
jgi:hypothetical protein